MSIKKLFESTDNPNNYLSDTTNKEAFQEVESAKNIEAIREKQETYIPQIDYTEPANFAKYGSAYLYYKSSLERVADYYPYDGSDAEVNEYRNKSLDIDKYIFDNLYPKSTGYAIVSIDGWGTKTNILAVSGGYGLSDTAEYITFYGGPNTVSDASTKTHAKLFQNPSSSNRDIANIYDTDIYTNEGLISNYGSGSRESNLKSDFDNGVTVEFWYKSGSLSNTDTQKQVVFDLWNNELSSSADFGRITIGLDFTSADQPWIVTAQSGNDNGATPNAATGIFQQSIGAGSSSIGEWRHYAFSFYNSGSYFITKLHIDGQLDDTNVLTANLNELNSKNMMGRIGALLTKPSASTAALEAIESGSTSTVASALYSGAGKLSGSLDEFRFWNIRRNSHEIAKHYFTHIRGGINTDISNTTLGLYYKFNEGITQTSSVDSVVLDYGGRISNGTWTGYGSNSRNTGSAIISASAATIEYRDPIIRTDHPDVVTLKTNLLNSGSYYDSKNNTSMLSMIPSWVVEEQENGDAGADVNNLKIVSHIIGTYFDKLHLLIGAMSRFRNQTYTSSSYTPLPFAQHMPQSLGLYTPTTFIDSDVLERFMNRNQTMLFEGDLTETKNLIYLNLYNNLAHIFKAKGTEKAIRNVFRCFNIDERLIKLNVYSKRRTYEIKNNLVQTLVNKTALNFNHKNNISGTVYQALSSSNNESLGYISGSAFSSSAKTYEDTFGLTVEADVLFPSFKKRTDTFDRIFITSSLFGGTTVDVFSASTLAGTNTTWLTGSAASSSADYANFQVFAIRDTEYSKNVYFKLTSSNDPFLFPTLTSSLFFDVYDNTEWNFSVRIKPSNYPLTEVVTGSTTYTYDVIFKGTNIILGDVQNNFTVSSSITQPSGRRILRSSKRLYAGAYKTNITGAVVNQSDILFNNFRYWTKYLDDTDIEQHAFDLNNRGVSGSNQYLSVWTPVNTGVRGNDQGLDIMNWNTLALDWNFDNVTGSDTAGNFSVMDVSSGSALLRDNYGWVGTLAGYQLAGSGSGFGTSSVDVVNKQAINAYKFVNPEMVVSSDMVRILDDDDKAFGTTQTVPDYKFTLEKSMYGAISEEMLKFFAGAIDFNNIIGEPVNRYRHRYKALEKLRNIFYRRVTEVKDVEKYLEYYKWFDDSLAEIIGQLLPASADFESDSFNIIESHVLERNKYKTQFPTMEFKSEDPYGLLTGWSEASWDAVQDSSGIEASPRKTNEKRLFWLKRALRSSAEITSGDPTVDSQRETIRDTIWSAPTMTQSAPVVSASTGYYTGSWLSDRQFAKNHNFEIQYPFGRKNKARIFKGGTNFEHRKNIYFVHNALYPGGPVNTEDGKFVPQNILVAFSDDMELLEETSQWEVNNKYKDHIKRYMKVQHGRDWEDGLGYSNLKSSFAFPFNIISSSVTTGYNKQVVERVTGGVEITNLHHDVYGLDMEKPMQGPFTEFAVGGHQSRHIALNKSGSTKTLFDSGLDNYLTRPEAWKIVLGKCDPGIGNMITGAIGMVGADYPWPEANAIGVTPYPMTGSQKAVFYREETAKRPCNFRNIQRTTASALGNYSNQYEIIHLGGAYVNPRRFVDQQPALPTPVVNHIADAMSSSANVINTFINLHRGEEGHFDFDLTYAPTQFTGSGNKTVIVNRFSNPGGPEVMSRGFQDLRGSEFSVYNTINNRNLTVIKPSQGPSGTISEATGSGIPGIRVYDIHGKDYGLRAHLARHSAKFGRDSFRVTSNWGASTDESASFHKVHRNTTKEIRLSGDAAVTASLYDNFYVQHQIPRKDKNYSWFTASLNISSSTSDMRYYQLAPTFGTMEGYYSTSAGWESYFDFITASSHTASSHPLFVQSTNRLNLFIDEPINSSTNTIGYSASQHVTSYINNTLVVSSLGIAIPANNLGVNYFNLLMAKRGNLYGYNWKKAGFRRSDNPILLKEKEDNQISALTSSDNLIAKYRLTPLSMKGRPTLINFSLSEDQDVTIKASNTNGHIFFDETALDNFVFSSQQTNITTSYDKILAAVKKNGYHINWVNYSEALFPSLYNEFYTSSIQRTAFNNKYWRSSQVKRQAVGATFTNSFNVKNYNISQSSWALDAQEDFLTRVGAVGPVQINAAIDTGIVVGPILAGPGNLRLSGAAGELQNNYFFCNPYQKTGSGAPSTLRQRDRAMIRGLSPAALYSRKHMLPNPRSVVARTGIKVAETGSVPYASGAFDAGSMVDIYCGEAYWDAPTQAGIVKKDGTSAVFESSASQPWWDDYPDFSYELKLIAKDFSILPEFRISEHIEDYKKYGLFNEGKTDTFEIPGTSLDSSNSGFYKDYSNSDFMKNFLSVKEDTLLTAKEIRLVCSAAIRFNPYKGFYPAQRTLDLVSQFSSSYIEGFYATGSEIFQYNASRAGSEMGSPDNRFAPGGQDIINHLGGGLRPLMQPLFSPGILFNSIKSGISVDYPVVVDETKIGRFFYSSSVSSSAFSGSLVMPGLFSGSDTGILSHSGPGTGSSAVPLIGTGSNWALGVKTYAASDDREEEGGWSGTGSYFDSRIPFEAIINPEDHIDGVMFPDMEAHPSAAINATGSWGGTPADDIYSRMSSNFFGEVGAFFLKDGSFSKLKSGIVSDDLRFSAGSVYGARLKMRRSTIGGRTYEYESSSWGNNQGYSKIGALMYSSSNYISAAAYSIPQDPRQNPDFKETFTMYSRPTAFGPDCAGRPTGSYATSSYVLNRSPADCFNGFNWDYTPPYYHGEAWVDFIFYPDSDKSYDLEQILAETDVVYWRADPGHLYATSDGSDNALLANFSNTSSFYVDGQHFRSIYGGKAINENSMQLSASLNLFGVETIAEQEQDKFGNQIKSVNKSSGKRWIIQPKFETPMLNFNDTGLHPITNLAGNISMPSTFGKAAIPRGMWHQFGIIPDKSTLGVFLEIGDIPTNWLKYHYKVLQQNSEYNNGIKANGWQVHKKMGSLTSLAGFKKTEASVRLGEIAASQTIKEAVVAVPYIIKSTTQSELNSLSGDYLSTKKSFIEISEERYAAALEAAAGSTIGDSLDAAGESIRKLLQKMDRYILPPQFDFLNNDSIDPVVMYIFEFEYKLDKDDLSYIWQNLAPRNYKKMEIQVESVAHELINTELLDEDILMDNENLRWMVFKVKQKGQTEYSDQIVTQAGSSDSKGIFDQEKGSVNRKSKKSSEQSDDYNLMFNWPYDYLSFVEMVKFEAEVLYHNEPYNATGSASTPSPAPRRSRGGGMRGGGSRGGGSY